MSWEVAMRWALHWARTTGERYVVRGRWVGYGSVDGRWSYVVMPAGSPGWAA